jgi:hypothetical protein
VHPHPPLASRAPATPHPAAPARPGPAGPAGPAGQPSALRAGAGRLALAGLLIAALGLGTAACGTSPPGAAASSTSPAPGVPAPAGTATGIPPGFAKVLSGSSAQDRLAFAQCMRENGVPSFPDTISQAALQAAGIEIRSASFLTAARACEPELTR